MNANFEKRKRHLLLGVLGCVLFMAGDWLLDMEGAGNVSIGFVESNWVNMSMWRFEASILLGALATPLYWCAAKEMIAIFEERCGKSKMECAAQRVFSIGVAAAVLSWVFIHIYSAFLFFCTGALLLAHNLYLLILPPVYWAFLTILMKCTEEKWLLEQYGTEYEIYCKRTNRCIPWFPRKEKHK